MTCPACTQSAERVSHLFHAGCVGCKARALARSQDFCRCATAGKLFPEYLAAIAKAEVTHQQVKEAWQADRLLNGSTE